MQLSRHDTDRQTPYLQENVLQADIHHPGRKNIVQIGRHITAEHMSNGYVDMVQIRHRSVEQTSYS